MLNQLRQNCSYFLKTTSTSLIRCLSKIWSLFLILQQVLFIENVIVTNVIDFSLVGAMENWGLIVYA